MEEMFSWLQEPTLSFYALHMDSKKPQNCSPLPPSEQYQDYPNKPSNKYVQSHIFIITLEKELFEALMPEKPRNLIIFAGSHYSLGKKNKKTNEIWEMFLWVAFSGQFTKHIFTFYATESQLLKEKFSKYVHQHKFEGNV